MSQSFETTGDLGIKPPSASGGVDQDRRNALALTSVVGGAGAAALLWSL